MSDLEITRKCAEAMGLDVVWQVGAWRFPNTQFEDSHYDPLHNDAQAMAMVKRFKLVTDWTEYTSGWTVLGGEHGQHKTTSDDLNRAICECVAKLAPL